VRKDPQTGDMRPVPLNLYENNRIDKYNYFIRPKERFFEIFKYGERRVIRDGGDPYCGLNQNPIKTITHLFHL